MTRTGLVLANLFHRKTRTTLTLLSVVMAFTLFGLLQAVAVVFSGSGDFVGATRLITQSRVSFTNSLPMRMVPELDAIPGVERVMYQQWFGGYSKVDSSEIFTFAVEPERLRDVYPEYLMPAEQWEAFARTRTGVIVGRIAADKWGWKVGDRIPLPSNIFPKKDGSKDWEFEVVGIYDGVDEQWHSQTNGTYINHAYFAEESMFGGPAGMFAIKLQDASMAEAVARTIDERFANTSDETRSMAEKDFTVNFFKQMGDIGLMVRWILFAVFFTLLLVVGNTMAQSVRERIPQFAVLKTLGFSDDSVLVFVLAETLALCTIGGVAGLLCATVLSRGIAANSGGFLPPIVIGPPVWIAGAIAIVGLSLAVGLLPALRARRLRIVDALAGR